ncbi:MLO protein homolog 1-like isoform X2 [Mangifera indica]|uniref:MLO protein homolog 1-like isoform X2 n=1 Tax=Mangifera indica TaxID=29780 RepID=UPI001CFB2E02|nr:MLO protein homolog 1-like isoform X2 [Mangifera indica]
MAGAPGDRSLELTPTWAVAAVCAVFVIISILIEHGIHSLAKWFQKRQNKAMSEALEKIKSELMLLGFISLLLTVGTRFISKICIPTNVGNTMLPCEAKSTEKNDGYAKRKLSWYDAGDETWRRVLAAGDGAEDYCAKKGKVSLISQSGVHQLHIFIFVLAVFHVLYSVITIVLARAKMKKWKSWESETSSLEYQFTNDPERFRFTRQTSFVRRHSGLSRRPGIRWIVAFFRQFFGSVSKVDYLTMRNGFINAHFAPNSSFDFHKYIKRSMEDDFKVVVGISIPLWIFAVTFLLINVYKWYTLDWLILVPFVILLLVGTKLELVIMEMAQEIQDRTTVVQGAPKVEPSNKYFWFSRPHWILLLIHYTLFQNAFQMALFLWTWYEFGLKSCFHENFKAILARVILGVGLQFLCSYITFPLYSLVTQMGSHMKKAIFEEQTAKALKKWHQIAKERNKKRKAGKANSSDPGSLSGGENSTSIASSPIHLLGKYKNKSDQPDVDIESVMNSPMSYLSDTEHSEIELGSASTHNNRHNIEVEDEDLRLRRNDGELHDRDFSFVKP